MTKKVTSGKRASRAASATSFFVSTATRALLHFSDQNRQRVFFQSLDVAHRSIVNGVTFADRYELLCIIIEHEQVYHLNFRRKKIAWLDLGENETFLSSANSSSKVESLIQRQIKMILQLFEKKRDTQC